MLIRTHRLALFKSFHTENEFVLMRLGWTRAKVRFYNGN